MKMIVKQRVEVNSVVSEIRQLHAEIGEALKTSLDKALRIGELLVGQKRSLGHGQWMPWVEANLPFTSRTATNYMRLHSQRDRLKSESVSDLGEAYGLLADHKTANLPDRSADSNREGGVPGWWKELNPNGCTILPRPPEGCAMTHNVDGDPDIVLIEPSSYEGFYYITILHDMGDGSQSVTRTRRPVPFNDQQVGYWLHECGLLDRQRHGDLQWRAFQYDAELAKAINQWGDETQMTPLERRGVPLYIPGYSASKGASRA